MYMVILSESGEDLSVSKLATIDEAAFYEGQVTDYLTFVCYLMNNYQPCANVPFFIHFRYLTSRRKYQSCNRSYRPLG